MHDIDASFRGRKEALQARRRKLRGRRIVAALVAVAVAAVGVFFYLTADQWSIEGLDQEMVQVDPGVETIPEDAPVYVPAIVDLAGDPMVINFANDGAAGQKVRLVPRPTDLLEPGISERVSILSDTMLSASERFMTTIPSSQEDFAFFQAQRAAPPIPSGDPAPMEPGADAPATDAPAGGGAQADGGGDTDVDMTPVDPGATPAAALPALDEGAGWGETIDQGEAALPEFKKTQIEDTTTIGIVTPETQRFQATDDIFVRVKSSRTLDSIVQENRFGTEDSRLAGEALKTLYKLDALEAGAVVALRGYRERQQETQMKLMQVSVYAGDNYIGTMARDASGAFVQGVDPWVREDLFHYSGEDDVAEPQRQYRLLDAIYSTAARNNVSTSVIGEAIMYLSRGQDLNAFVAPGDKLVLVFSDTGRGTDGGGGRVLYAAVQGAQKNIECFVYPQSNGEYACVTDHDAVQSVTVVNGMVTPVNGVMTSTFGPRMHPILKTVRVHKGVDWAAPVGSKVFAAFDGEIAFDGDGGEYGNLVRISHAGGRETRYAHLSKFAPGLEVGLQVKAGDLIGFVGTSGLSTGPHLHFELYAGGQAIDPLGSVTETADASDPDGSAVETLTDVIIHVESGGKSNAKNPLSTATGLGQFIESTWIRMMNTYRPDLARSLSRAELLALRFDPTISREMVKNLAREGEAYLRARGHQITAGRLYLCHFLGMEGAHVVLSSPADSSLADVLGSGVISANPFLTGKTVSYVMTWAENKMNRRGVRRTAPDAPATTTVQKAVPPSPELIKYKAAIVALLSGDDKTAAPTPAAAASTDAAPAPEPPKPESPEPATPASQSSDSAAD
jgi:murein DD-endopeptidase MepM/ murein hydrolase activator NlpD